MTDPNFHMKPHIADRGPGQSTMGDSELVVNEMKHKKGQENIPQLEITVDTLTHCTVVLLFCFPLVLDIIFFFFLKKGWFWILVVHKI